MNHIIYFIAELGVFSSLVYLLIRGLEYITDSKNKTQNEHLALKNKGVAFNDDEGSFKHTGNMNYLEDGISTSTNDFISH